MGMDLLFTPVRSPWYKGIIERFGGTANVRFFHWLPGTTLGKATSDLGYNASEHGVLTFDDFEELLRQYITTIHNKSPRRGKQGTPERRFLEGCQLWPVRVPDSIEDFDAAVALTRSATLRQSGLHFLDLQYQNEVLGELFNRSPAGTRLTFKVNPLNLHTVLVRHPVTNAYFPVKCVTDHEWPRTLSFHLAVRQFAKTNGLNPSDKRQLSRAQRDLLNAIEKAAADSKRALRRMQAEVYRQGQDLQHP
jgi:putative transposase